MQRPKERKLTPLASEIILTVSERRNRQKLTLSSTAAPFVFGRGRDCSFVLRRNNVGEHQSQSNTKTMPG